MMACTCAAFECLNHEADKHDVALLRSLFLAWRIGEIQNVTDDQWFEAEEALERVSKAVA